MTRTVGNDRKRRVDEILCKAGARCLWESDDPETNFVLHGWALPDGRLVVVQAWDDKMGGVEVYVNGQCPGEYTAIERWVRGTSPRFERLLTLAEEIAADKSCDLVSSERRLRLYQAIEAAGGSINKHDATCTKCGAEVKDPTWLELDARRHVYRRAGEVPLEDSQGAFPFGPGCAEAELRRKPARGSR